MATQKSGKKGAKATKKVVAAKEQSTERPAGRGHDLALYKVFSDWAQENLGVKITPKQVEAVRANFAQHFKKSDAFKEYKASVAQEKADAKAERQAAAEARREARAEKQAEREERRAAREAKAKERADKRAERAKSAGKRAAAKGKKGKTAASSSTPKGSKKGKGKGKPATAKKSTKKQAASKGSKGRVKEPF